MCVECHHCLQSMLYIPNTWNCKMFRILNYRSSNEDMEECETGFFSEIEANCANLDVELVSMTSLLKFDVT